MDGIGSGCTERAASTEKAVEHAVRVGGTGGRTGGDTSGSRTGSTGEGARANASEGTRSNLAESASTSTGAARAGHTSGTSGPGTAGADSQSGQSRPAQGSSISGVVGGAGARAASTGGSLEAANGGSSGLPVRSVSEAASGGSSGLPGRSVATIRPSSASINGAEVPNRSPGDARSVENRNGGGSGLLGAGAGFGPFGSGSGTGGGSPVPGFGPSLGRAFGEPRASAGDFGRLGPGLPSEGPSFGVRERGHRGFDAFDRGGSVDFRNPFSGPSIAGVGGTAVGNAGGRRRLGDEGLFGEETDFSSAFGASGFNGNRGTSFPTSRISSQDSGFGGDVGEESFGRTWNRGAGGFGGSALGFGDFSSGSNTEFGGTGGGLGLPEGLDGGPGPSGGSSDGENGPLPGVFAQQGPGTFLGSENKPDGPAGWPSPQSFNNIESSALDGTRGFNSPVASVPGGSQRPRLLQRLWQSRHRARGLSSLVNHVRKPDPRTTAGLFLGSLAAAAGIGGLRARIAAGFREGREQGRFGPRRTFCFGRCRARQRRLNAGMKVAEDILKRIPGSLQRLY
ncbi:uncharacterized protein LOC144160516 [Haemaphysalis longicornis]